MSLKVPLMEATASPFDAHPAPATIQRTRSRSKKGNRGSQIINLIVLVFCTALLLVNIVHWRVPHIGRYTGVRRWITLLALLQMLLSSIGLRSGGRVGRHRLYAQVLLLMATLLVAMVGVSTSSDSLRRAWNRMSLSERTSVATTLGNAESPADADLIAVGDIAIRLSIVVGREIAFFAVVLGTIQFLTLLSLYILFLRQKRHMTPRYEAVDKMRVALPNTGLA